MSTTNPSQKRYRKLPRNVLSWMVAFIAGMSIVMIWYRYGGETMNLRAARKDEKEKKDVVSQRPGDPAQMRHLLEEAAAKAREEKAKEDRLPKKPTQDGFPGGTPPVANGTPPQGRMPAGVPGIEQYEAVKLQAQKSLHEPGKAPTQLAAYEFDGNGAKGSAVAGSSGNPQLDALMSQMTPAGAQRNPGGLDAATIQKLIAQAGGAGTAAGGTARDNDDWLKKTGERNDNPPLVARAPLSPYALYQGGWIPCNLMWAINTDLPGDVGCQVSENVFGNGPNRILLIPRYARLYGKYNTDIADGQERILIAFQRLIYPSGASIDLGAMSGADSTGRAGVGANVNNHFWKMFGSSFLIAGVARAFSGRTSNAPTISVNTSVPSSLEGAAGEVLVDTVKKIMEKNTRIKPTLDNDATTKLLVFVNRDMILPTDITLTREK